MGIPESDNIPNGGLWYGSLSKGIYRKIWDWLTMEYAITDPAVAIMNFPFWGGHSGHGLPFGVVAGATSVSMALIIVSLINLEQIHQQRCQSLLNVA